MEDPAAELAAMRVLAAPGHPHVLRLLDVGEDDNLLFVVLEYAPGGELFDVVVSNPRPTEAEARATLRQIFRGVAYMHASRVAHRDLSLENVLVADGGVLKIIDFGLSVAMVPAGARGPARAAFEALPAPAQVVGKEFYVPPEVSACG